MVRRKRAPQRAGRLDQHREQLRHPLGFDVAVEQPLGVFDGRFGKRAHLFADFFGRTGEDHDGHMIDVPQLALAGFSFRVAEGLGGMRSDATRNDCNNDQGTMQGHDG